MRMSDLQSEKYWKEVSFVINIETLEPATKQTAKEKTETWTFWLKQLSSGENDALQDQVVETKVQTGGARQKEAALTSDFQYSDYAARKRMAAIAKWEWVTDDKGNNPPINIKNVKALPTWVATKLSEAINKMNNLEEDVAGN